MRHSLGHQKIKISPLLSALEVRNVFDIAPSTIDPTGVGGVCNFANGAGYDILSRIFFISTKSKFT
jgi:hypothetical protein